HADRVRAACLAQRVNAIAPIMTQAGGAAWRQTIFWPFADFANLGHGKVLRTQIDCPTYSATYYDPRGKEDLYFPLPEVPYLKLAAIHGDDTLTLFALNRHLDEPIRINVSARGFSELALERAQTLHNGDLRAANTQDDPDRVRPEALQGVEIRGSEVVATLPAASWTVLRMRAR